MALRIVLADDHRLVREGLKVLLEQNGLEVIGEACNGQQAVQLAERLAPDAAVLDVAMPILNGIDAAREIGKVSPRTKVVILTMLTDESYVLESLRAGIKGFVLKSQAANELLQAIEHVCRGNVYLTTAASNAVVQAYITNVNLNTPAPSLTEREREILQLIAEGKTAKEIASLLGVSTKTAEFHRSNIMEKLNIHDVAGLVRYAVRHGLVQP